MPTHNQNQSTPLDPVTLIQNYGLILQEKDDASRVGMLFAWRLEVISLINHSPELKGTTLHPMFQDVMDEVKQH